jgi:asparagine synthase (glutamine-hydrolysing)
MKMMPDNASYETQLPGTIETYVNGVFHDRLTYSTLPCVQPYVPDVPSNLVRASLYEAVRKRVMNTDRPMACLLSGGLDSSIITALVQRVRLELGYTDPLETYSIGLAGAEDLKYAGEMAAFLGTRHTSVVMTEMEFFNAIPAVIDAIESYDTTTVRASVGNFLIARYISEHSDAKVIFNGDGSDELAGGYLYFHYAPDAIAKDQECRRLLKDIHLFDALRSDKCIASNGLEARTPFLDRSFVQTYLSLPLHARFPAHCEKYLLRRAFEDLLPPHICWRTKEAFSDGVSSMSRSWYQIITEMIPTKVTSSFYTNPIQGHNPPTTPEQYYYRSLYRYDPLVIPYFWMPRFVQQNDCSARTLSVYKK